MKKIGIMFLTAILGMLIMTAPTSAGSLAGTTTDKICQGGETTDADSCQKAQPLAQKIETVVKTFSGLVGAFAVGMIVYGGFKYITSQGDPKAAEGAKNVIWYSGIGLFIVLVAFIVFDLLADAMV